MASIPTSEGELMADRFRAELPAPKWRVQAWNRLNGHLISHRDKKSQVEATAIVDDVLDMARERCDERNYKNIAIGVFKIEYAEKRVEYVGS